MRETPAISRRGVACVSTDAPALMRDSAPAREPQAPARVPILGVPPAEPAGA